jgi:uncharacterized protein (TIGR03067 family)
MKNKLITLIVALCGAGLVLTACSTLHPSDDTKLQGSWEGHAPKDTSGQKLYLVFSGKNFDFHDADKQVWYKGSFVLREDTTPKQFIATVTDSCQPQYVGKTSMAIYQLVEGKLSIAGNEPGLPEPPASFDAPGARWVEMTKQ